MKELLLLLTAWCHTSGFFRVARKHCRYRLKTSRWRPDSFIMGMLGPHGQSAQVFWGHVFDGISSDTNNEFEVAAVAVKRCKLSGDQPGGKKRFGASRTLHVSC